MALTRARRRLIRRLQGGAALPPVPGVAYVLFVAGQSNSVVLGTDALGVPATLQGAMANVKIWRLDTNAWDTYQAGVNSDFLINDPAGNVPLVVATRAPPTNFGPEARFALLWKKYRPADTLYIVKVGKGNSALQAAARQGTIAIWDTSLQNELWGLMKSTKNAAFAALAAQGLTPVVLGTFWMQGEADATVQTTANAYQTVLEAFIASFRSTIMGGGAAKFAIGRISQAAAWTYGSVVRAAQAVVGVETNNAWFSTDSYALQSDGIHYTPDSVKAEGTDAYYKIMGLPAHFYDDFDRNNTPLENCPQWTQVDGAAGSITINNYGMNGVGNVQAGASYLAPDTGSLNHFVQATVKGLTINALCARHTDSNNYLSVRTSDGTTNTIQVVQKVAGTTTVIGSYGTPVTGDTLRLEVTGNTFVLKKNGTQIGTGAVSASLTSTKCGVINRFTASMFDDFESGALAT